MSADREARSAATTRLREWMAASHEQDGFAHCCETAEENGLTYTVLSDLLDVAEAAERYLATSNTLAFRPSKDVETAAAKAHHDLTEALADLSHDRETISGG